MLQQILTSLFGAGSSSIEQSIPPSAMRNAGRCLLASAETAVRSGDWQFDATNDPSGIIAALDETLSLVKCDEIVEIHTAQLLDRMVAAMTTGEWRGSGDALEAMLESGSLVNHRPGANDREPLEKAA